MVYIYKFRYVDFATHGCVSVLLRMFTPRLNIKPVIYISFADMKFTIDDDDDVEKREKVFQEGKQI